MKKEMKIGKILEIVSNHFNISKDDLLSQNRQANIVIAKQFAAYFLRYELGITFREIGEIMNKQTSTVSRAVQCASDLVRHDVILQREMRELKDEIMRTCGVTGA